MAEAAYQYVRRTYGVNPGVGQRVLHDVTRKFGTIAREDKSQSHHVMVRFDGQRFASPCHPTELDYQPKEGSDG
ncbi:hypothetical protein [Ancylobacter defluvii]|uniref:Uncharacterized protein n=1 Tax=Ancylobacter defluvii TaxID=1282440 RepID=A0A9W6NDJ9_9HYPH|nr:hypothetical protein [Ancylobacter defluvii]MBS7588240.1 hypothetical protein [Ancylobacter defluvii]GLK86636.1 hypothetical protein GCM10017653_47060 [Ancylobacter defluvii]